MVIYFSFITKLSRQKGQTVTTANKINRKQKFEYNGAALEEWAMLTTVLAWRGEKKGEKYRWIVHILLSLFVHLTVTCLLQTHLKSFIFVLTSLTCWHSYKTFHTTILDNFNNLKLRLCQHIAARHAIVLCVLHKCASVFVCTVSDNWFRWRWQIEFSSSVWFNKKKDRIRKSKRYEIRSVLYTHALRCFWWRRVIAIRKMCWFGSIHLAAFSQWYSCLRFSIFMDAVVAAAFATEYVAMRVMIPFQLCKRSSLSYKYKLFFDYANIVSCLRFLWCCSFLRLNFKLYTQSHICAIHHTVISNKFQFNICK